MLQAPGVEHEASRAPRDRRRPREIALLALAIAPLAALPWLFTYWPSVDGPNHLAMVHVLQRLGEPGNPFEPYLRSELRPGSYTMYYWLMLGLGRAMDLHLAERLVESAIIAGLPLSVLFLLRRIAPERRHNALLAVPLATGWLVMLGFVNFLLGFLLGLLALGTLWGRKGGRARLDSELAPAGWRSRAAGSALLLLATIAHPFAVFLIGAALLLLEGPALVRARTWAWLVPVMSPAAIVAGIPVLTGRLAGGGTGGGAGAGAFQYLWVNEVLLRSVETTILTFSSWELVVRGVPLVALAWWGLRSAARQRLRGTDRDDGIARLVWGTLALYLLVPDKVRSIAFISPRFTLLFAVACALIASRPRWAAPPRRLAFIMIALVWALGAVQHAAMSRVEAQVRDVVAAGRAIPRGSVVLPLMFETTGGAANVFPLLHSWGHLVIERDIVVPYLFASGGTSLYGGGEFRPLRFVRPFSRAFLPNLGEHVTPRITAPFTGWRYLPTERRGFRTSPDLLPWLVGVSDSSSDCSFDDWLALRYRGILATVSAYDRVLLYAPHEEFLRRAREVMTVESRVGRAWVLRPTRATAPPGDGPYCVEARP